MKKWLKKISLFQLLVFLSCWTVLAQQPTTIRGNVTLPDGGPLPGVTVVVKGTTQGTVTDANGNYTLPNVPGDATLVFSFVGMSTQEVAVGNQTNVDIRMAEETIGLEEVVAVGYGTMKKSDLTGSVVSVGSESVNAFPTTNVLQALTGRAAGVQVLQTTGEPGGAISVRIRGTNSIRGSNEPLYVIDGFPTSGSNPTILNNLDIESIEILKDASATAIYGSRGANGVVLITTKGGKAGRTSVHLESNFGIQSIRKKMDMMNAREYAEFYNIVAANDGWGQAFTQEEVDSFGEGFDWQDFVFREAPIQNHNITVNGGNEKTQFSISGSMFDEEGIIENSGYNRYSLRTNISHDINEKFRISSNITLSKINRQNQSSRGGGRGTSLISGALYPFPTVTPTNEDGSWRNLKTIYHWSPEINNPALFMYETNSEVISDKVLANAAFEYKPIPELTFRIMGGIENSDDRSDYYRTNDYIGTSAYASVSTSKFTSLLNENTISYSQTFGKHRISGLVGFTYQDFLSTSLSGSGTDFLSDVQESYDLSAASVPGIPDSGYSLSVILSGLGRFNYNYDDKYLATVSFRTDGSSKYSEGNKWGYFPSGSLAWRISNEDFLSDSEILSDLKFRAGWGATGSQAIGAYATLNNLYSGKTVFGGEYHSYFAPGTNLPGDLKWESTEQTNLGLDVGFFENRLHFTVDYYSKKTRDLLNTVPLPPSGGFRTTVDNVGVISNKGLEFALNADILSGPVKWLVDANISFNRSKVEKLYKGEDIQGSYINVTLIDDHFNILREGEPFAVFYGYLDDGYDETGRLGKYKDLEPDGIINVNDKTIIGDPNPDFIYGFNSTLSYMNFDFTIFIQGTQGNDIFNLAGLSNTLDVGFGGNMPKEVLYNHWTPENPDAKYPTPSRTNQVRVSDRFIEDGSYLRFRNIQLGYNIPFSKLGIAGIKNVQVYVGGKNLITITNYSRWDPEVNSLGGSSSINQGIDYHTYPVNKSVNFGIRADF
jgi:TonB-dependent starch-binding outer membrane protein SusC